MHIPWLLRCLGPLHPSTLRSDISFPGRLFWTIWFKATPHHQFLHTTNYSKKHHSLHLLYSAYKKLKWSSLHIYIFIHFPISSKRKIYGQRRVTSARWLKSVIPDWCLIRREQLSVYIHRHDAFVRIPNLGLISKHSFGPPKQNNCIRGEKEWFYFGCITFPQDGTKESPWAYSFYSGKRRSQHGHSASPTSWDVSWEAHLDIASWRSLGESRDK